MIQLSEDIEYWESGKVPLDPKHKRIYVEVASNLKIDIAIVDADKLKEFDESDTGDDFEIEWIENTRRHDFEFKSPSDKKKRYLFFWNANERDEAIIAYKITPLEAA